jgi:hypothetical protein
MLTVACVLKEGGIYTREHVSRLRQQLIGRINEPFEFYCLDNSLFFGYWAKISLFKPGRFKGRVLYLDLDVDIVGNLDEIVNYPAPFGSIKDWLNPQMINSSVMVWDAGYADSIYEKFDPSIIGTLRWSGGDQQYISENFLSITKFPREWCVSYKYDVQPYGSVPKNTKVVVYHGHPKPWEIKGKI